jgi:hypothetical protein
MLAKFEAYSDGEDWCARGIGADVFTQGATLDELMDNIREAAEVHFEDVLRQGDGCQSSDRETKEEIDRDVVK